MTDLTLSKPEGAPRVEQQTLLRGRIELLLPEVMRRTLPTSEAAPVPRENPLSLFMDVMALLQAPSLVILESLHDYFDVYAAPEPFITYMASWFHLEPLWIDDSQARRSAASLPAFPTGAACLRQLLASISDLTRWRGTAQGLKLFLEIATGVPGFVIEEVVRDEEGEILPFVIRVRIPVAAQPYRVLIERIIRAERPLYVRYQLLDESAPATPPSPPEP